MGVGTPWGPRGVWGWGENPNYNILVFLNTNVFSLNIQGSGMAERSKAPVVSMQCHVGEPGSNPTKPIVKFKSQIWEGILKNNTVGRSFQCLLKCEGDLWVPWSKICWNLMKLIFSACLKWEVISDFFLAKKKYVHSGRKIAAPLAILHLKWLFWNGRGGRSSRSTETYCISF